MLILVALCFQNYVKPWGGPDLPYQKEIQKYG